jgi:hypothetical protein
MELSVVFIKIAEIVLINLLIPQSRGTFYGWETPPRPLTGSILHLFFSGLYICSIENPLA